MATNPLESPVVIDGVVSEEKLSELMAFQAEYPELDYKSHADPTPTQGRVELAKDVGAMRVRGGYLVIGVDGRGQPTGGIDDVDAQKFDEANLRPQLLRYLAELEIRSQVFDRDGHRVALICVLPSPAGCTFMSSDGIYLPDGADPGDEVALFQAGDVFWRDGTQSVRLSQEGLEEVLQQRLAREKQSWMDEQAEIRRRERAELEAAYEGRARGEAPLGAVSFELPASEITGAALEMLRSGDEIAVRHLLNDALARSSALIDANDIEEGLAELLDRLACLGATFLDYEQEEWLLRVIDVFSQIYSMPLEEGDAQRFGYSTQISRDEKAPRVWLVILERVFALGALAVRSEHWDVVRELTLQLPAGLNDPYDTNWLRHGLTMTSRASHYQEDGSRDKISLLTLARSVIADHECLRPDGLAADDETILSSLCQFDALSNVTAIGGAETTDGRVFYPNFARFRQDRMQPMVNRLLVDNDMRAVLFPLGDGDLAIALEAIGRGAASEGWRYDGFMGWEQTPVAEFIQQNLPEGESS